MLVRQACEATLDAHGLLLLQRTSLRARGALGGCGAAFDEAPKCGEVAPAGALQVERAVSRDREEPRLEGGRRDIGPATSVETPERLRVGIFGPLAVPGDLDEVAEHRCAVTLDEQVEGAHMAILPGHHEGVVRGIFVAIARLITHSIRLRFHVLERRPGPVCGIHRLTVRTMSGSAHRPTLSSTHGIYDAGPVILRDLGVNLRRRTLDLLKYAFGPNFLISLTSRNLPRSQTEMTTGRELYPDLTGAYDATGLHHRHHGIQVVLLGAGDVAPRSGERIFPLQMAISTKRSVGHLLLA